MPLLVDKHDYFLAYLRQHWGFPILEEKW